MIIANWRNETSTFAVMLSDTGELHTIERKHPSDVWSPPSDPIMLTSAIDEFKEMLEVVNLSA